MQSEAPVQPKNEGRRNEDRDANLTKTKLQGGGRADRIFCLEGGMLGLKLQLDCAFEAAP